jgi:hypothetical protein
VKRSFLRIAGLALSLGLSLSHAQIGLIAVGSLTESRAGSNVDLSGLKYKLENGVPANVLGGMGSGLAYAVGNTFLAIPDRGPNAVAYDSAIDDTASYIDLANAVDVSSMDGTAAASHAVKKDLFLDVVKALTANGIPADQIPAKIEGIAFGADVKKGTTTLHTLWIANDNDFLATVADSKGNQVPNPSQFYVFGFTDADLNGSTFENQNFKTLQRFDRD